MFTRCACRWLYCTVLPARSVRHRCVPHGVESRSQGDHHTLARHWMHDALPIVPTPVVGALCCCCCCCCGLSPLEVLAPRRSADFVVVVAVCRVGLPPSPSHYHLSPRIPPLELKTEPSRPALYWSCCGRAGKLNPMCSADVLLVWSGGGVVVNAPPHIPRSLHCTKDLDAGSTGMRWLVSGVGIPQSPEALWSLVDSCVGGVVGYVGGGGRWKSKTL